MTEASTGFLREPPTAFFAVGDPGPSPTAAIALAFGVGIAITVIAQRLKAPPLLALLLVGTFLGAGGLGIIDAGQLGTLLPSLASLAVSVLIFEGTLHLDREALGRAPRAVRGLLTTGALVTWLGATLAAGLLLGIPWPASVVLGAILIVTGPTVIQPLLARVRLTPRLHSVLLSEGILIDPIGVIAAVVTLEFVGVRRELTGAESLPTVVWSYASPFAIGAAFGAAAGFGTLWLLKRPGWHGRAGDRASVLIALTGLSIAVGGAALFPHEPGLVAAAVYGLILARLGHQRLVVLRRVMDSLAMVLVGFLFVLLGSRIRPVQFAGAGWREAAFVAAMMLAVRPGSVLAATVGTRLTLRERAYLALIAPRGIVAVATAAVAGAALSGAGGSGPVGSRIELAILLTVVATVLWSSVFGGWLATLLGVRGAPANGVLIVGAHRLGREIGASLRRRGITARLIDTSPDRVAAALADGLDAVRGDATDSRWMEGDAATSAFGFLIAATGNREVDAVVARWGTEVLGNGRAVAWPPEQAALRLDEIAAGLEQGKLFVDEARSERDLRVVVAAVRAGRLDFSPPSSGPPAEAYIGLRARAVARESQPRAAA